MKVLIVEDYEIIAKNVSKFLSLEGYETHYVGSCEQAKVEIENMTYDLMLLDLNLPDMNGKDFCKLLRGEGNSIPIIMLTSSDTQKEIITGLQSGADDYISKPFDYDELLVRMQTVLRRGGAVTTSSLIVGNTHIDLNKKQVSQEGKNIYLSVLEYRLYEYLVKNKGRVIGRNELYENVWGEYDSHMFSRSVDVYVNYVRKKLGKNSVLTRKGEGYYVE